MGIFGGSSSSSASQTSSAAPTLSADNAQEVTTLTASGTGNLITSPGGSGQMITAGKNSTITTTDLGSVSRAMDLALESVQSTNQTAKELASASIAAGQSSVTAAYQLAENARKTEGAEMSQNWVKYIFGLGLAATVAWAYARKGA